MNEDKKMKSGWLSYPFFLAGIVLFFIIDGYSRYVNRIRIIDMLLYSALWLGIVFGLLYITNRKFKSLHKSALYSGFLISAYLFFGDIKAGLANISVFDRFSVVCLILLFFGLVLFRYLSKSPMDFSKVVSYLNLLFITLIMFDLCRILIATHGHATMAKKAKNGLLSPSTGERPDIYLIVLDEYAGNSVLKKYFGFDNSVFLNSLQDRSFFVSEHSFSNYRSTPISIASMFEMSYLTWAYKGKTITVEDYSEAEKTIENSSLLYFFKNNGYEFYNYSIFNIGNNDSEFDPELLPTNLKLITSKTLGNQFRKYVLVTLEAQLGSRYDWVANFLQEKYRIGNRKLVDRTLKIAKSKSTHPKFIYTHIFMPHWPYLNDSNGEKIEYNAFRTVSDTVDRKHYLDYLKYTNYYILEIIDEIKKSTKNGAAIILMSDHGYRKLTHSPYGTSNYNLNATFLPSKNYGRFYDSISNVNQFRVVLNSVFEMKLPLKADSIVF